MGKPIVKIDAQVTREFQTAFKRYMEVSKRTLEEACNTHAYFIAKGAVNTTKAVPKEKIHADLMASSKVAEGVPLAAVLVNYLRGKKGLPGLTGAKMQSAMEKYIRIKEATRNFLRSGWIPSIKKLAPFVRSKRGAMKTPQGVRVKGSNKGGATPAQSTWRPIATIWNSIIGGKDKPHDKVKPILKAGAEEAIKRETVEMYKYVQMKLQKAAEEFHSHH